MIGVWFKDENKGTSENTVSEKRTCQAGPCQSTILNKAGHCRSCQEILDENGCKTYGEFVKKGSVKDVDSLISGIGKMPASNRKTREQLDAEIRQIMRDE